MTYRLPNLDQCLVRYNKSRGATLTRARPHLVWPPGAPLGTAGRLASHRALCRARQALRVFRLLLYAADQRHETTTVSVQHHVPVEIFVVYKVA
ncbi:hypothetical protein E2C01_000871 [Portunus trituberculatus]|uniref:Uncharacterized protein n=1 Tax=Portunus trituberculatus TaxID=210409 RepID=A0A5B7CHR7_PORTR|nr:hypothetical protein [Portunus trituberculatus]